MANQKFETEDMTFVAVLLVSGIHHEEMKNINGGCRWVYEGPVVERVLEHLVDYNEDASYVEPREFTRKLGSVRQEMYKFLGHNPSRVRSAS